MFLPDKSKQHQQLTQYLRQAARRHHSSVDSVPIAFVAVGLMFLAALGLVANLASYLILPIAIIFTIGLVAVFNRIQPKKRKPEARERLMMEAQPVIKSMLAHAEAKRLHRELDQASITVLEECARYYWQVHQVFDSVFWRSDTLPTQYQGIREHALRAAETAMDELMLLYRNSIPEKPRGGQPMEFVEEVVEEYVFKKPKPPEMIPATFEPTRRIAEKLRLLAEEADRVSQQITADEALPSLTNPGQALDTSIGELRQIRQAEEELRQNLGG